MAGTETPVSVIDARLARFTGAQHAALVATVAALRRLLPGASDVISYGMPALALDGVSVIAVDGFTRHNSLFPMSGSIPALLASDLKGYTFSKGTIQFPVDAPIPMPLLRAIVKAKIAELNASYPKKSGEFKEFYDNGRLKASGRMRDGVLVGTWRWYRRDGSLMRTGSFTAGEQSGEWVTYAADGRMVKRTHMGKRATAAGRGSSQNAH